MGSFNRDDRGGRRSFGGGGRSFGGSRGGFDRGGDRGPREMFSAICSNCGKECQVPFKPTNGKPVYCSDCFEKMGGRSERSDERPRFGDRRPQSVPMSDPNKGQFNDINIKLDKILRLLEPKIEAKVVSAPVEAEVKAPKVKKVASKKKK